MVYRKVADTSITRYKLMKAELIFRLITAANTFAVFLAHKFDWSQKSASKAPLVSKYYDV